MDDPDPRVVDEPPSDENRFKDQDKLDAIEICVIERSDLWRLSPEDEARLIDLALIAVGKSGVALGGGHELSIVLSSDDEVRQLNATFRGKDTATNVLSFPVLDVSPDDGHGGLEPLPLGDVIIAYETVQREAAELGLDPLHHLYHLTVHGVLHLLGFDHEEDAAAEEMEGLEREILLSEGYHDPYGEKTSDCLGAQGATVQR